MNLGKKYTEQRLETACYRALATGITRVKQVKNILEKGQDKQSLPEVQGDLLQDIDHQNIIVRHSKKTLSVIPTAIPLILSGNWMEKLTITLFIFSY
ncbi:MAG: hypothetical protein ACJAT8_000472 [Cellvibrionaceae bacterium]